MENIKSTHIEKKLWASEEKLRIMLESLNDAVSIVDLKGNIIDANKAHLHMFGYSQKEELIGQNALDCITIKDKAKAIDGLRDIFKGDAKYPSEYRLKDKDGREFDVELTSTLLCDSAGKSTGIISIMRDITERKKMEQRFKESEEKYRTLFESSKDGIFMTDIKGNFLDCNQALLDMIGYTKEELNNLNVYDLTPEKWRDLEDTILSTQVMVRGYSQEFEKELIKKDGTIFPVNLKVWLKTDKAGHVLGLWTIIRDITKIKEIRKLEKKFQNVLEQAVVERTKELNEALEQQKLYLDHIAKASQFKTEFLATMSHELRTPLNAIIGFTDLLLEEAYGALNEKQLEFLNDIKSAAEHQFDMIKHILNISKIEAGQLKLNISKFSLNNVIDQVEATMKSLYTRKKLKLKIKGLDSEKEICADPIRFKEILLNLVDNAIKFTIEGKITIIIQEKYDQWIFKIRDTGIGIAKKDFDLIFKDFKRVESPYINSIQGTGLGLSLTKRLVNLHRGEITFTSILGAGSTFTFTIPKKLEKEL